MQAPATRGERDRSKGLVDELDSRSETFLLGRSLRDGPDGTGHASPTSDDPAHFAGSGSHLGNHLVVTPFDHRHLNGFRVIHDRRNYEPHHAFHYLTAHDLTILLVGTWSLLGPFLLTLIGQRRFGVLRLVGCIPAPSI